MDEFFFFLLVMFVAALVMRNSLFVNLLYLFSGIYIAGRLWNNMALRSIGFVRTLTPRVFAGEEITVKLEVFNRSILPVVWLRLEEALPIELSKGAFKRIITLPSLGRAAFEYKLNTHKRGCYRVGPLRVVGGDLFGLSATRTHSGGEQILVVYPRVYNLPGLSLPSRSPMGSLRTTQLIFEDPTRVRNKRDYVSGDSLRRIDWKASAASGRLQVKQFEPSIALETMVFVNLNADEYEMRTRYDSLELAVVVAASIANWVSAKQQAVGLATNGLDPFDSLETVLREQLRIDPSGSLSEAAEANGKDGSQPPPDISSLPLQAFNPLPPRKGQMMRVLDILARVQPASAESVARQSPEARRNTHTQQTSRPQSFIELLQAEQANLPWGTTLVLVTGSAGEDLLDMIFKLRRQGLIVVLALIGQVPHLQTIRQQTRHFNIPLLYYRSEMELSQFSGTSIGLSNTAAYNFNQPGPAAHARQDSV